MNASSTTDSAIAQPTLNRIRRLVGTSMLFLFLSVSRGAAAQAAPTPPESSGEAKAQFYDVVSIKPNKSGPGSVSVHSGGDIYTARNVSIEDLLTAAYGVRKDMVFGVAGPLASARFDIDAKVLDPDVKAIHEMSNKEYGAMLLPMLQERFKLQAHMETKVVPVYELVVLKGGPKFKESPPGDTKQRGTSIQNRELEAGSISMERMATTIGYQVPRPVIDKTGLTGIYDLSLKWSRDDAEKQDDGTADAAPNIFTALQEQLGLKLVPTKGPVESLVVDHVELPSEN